ncbi:MAG: ATP-dependent protease ATPase subunit HslU [Phycisphaerales bacterium]|nr:ATP-dependent protease ATPase subunit HslU [Phycisphaerales bacterium]
MIELTPRQILRELDRYIIGQDTAKRAVAIAIRNRWRRLQLPAELREDVVPKNILMVGPTGVGKTEIARRLAMLVDAPFVKVEATKFTEVGYVGRDVDGIIRDLLERSIALERRSMSASVQERARESAEDRVLDQLFPSRELSGLAPDSGEERERRERTREKLRGQLRSGGLTDQSVEVSMEERSIPQHAMASTGLDQFGPEFEQLFERLMPRKSRRQRLSVREALEVFTQQEIDRLIDHDALHQAAIARCEQTGIVFLDEIDKIAGVGGAESVGPEVSRSGVQRDLLPLVEGTTVSTRYGQVRTNHVLFIAAGAFTNVNPCDLMPELQGRFPIRVHLDDLTGEDLYRILTEPQNALIRQQVELMRTEGVKLTITEEAIREMAEMAFRANQMLENIGARRLYTIVERVVEEIAFSASDASHKEVVIDPDYVRMRLADILDDEERSQFEL